MTVAWHVLAMLIELLTWLASPPSSIADAARREEIRRQLMPRAAFAVSNDTLPAVREGDAATPSPDSGVVASGPVRSERPSAGGQGSGTSSSAVSADEKTWRDRMTRLGSALIRDQESVAATDSRLRRLQMEVDARDDPAQQAVLRQDIARSLAEIRDLTNQIEAGQRSIDALREEARRLNVPPGWLR